MILEHSIQRQSHDEDFIHLKSCDLPNFHTFEICISAILYITGPRATDTPALGGMLQVMWGQEEST
jgi:hypothetical protein